MEETVISSWGNMRLLMSSQKSTISINGMKKQSINCKGKRRMKRIFIKS